MGENKTEATTETLKQIQKSALVAVFTCVPQFSSIPLVLDFPLLKVGRNLKKINKKNQTIAPLIKIIN